MISDDGKRDTEKLYYERKDFWATTSNKQLNFVQNVYAMLAAGAGALLWSCQIMFFLKRVQE